MAQGNPPNLEPRCGHAGRHDRFSPIDVQPLASAAPLPSSTSPDPAQLNGDALLAEFVMDFSTQVWRTAACATVTVNVRQNLRRILSDGLRGSRQLTRSRSIGSNPTATSCAMMPLVIR